MGRWGHRLFESDQDLDLVSDLDGAFGSDDKIIGFYKMINQADNAAGQDELTASVRQKLDTDGLGDKLFAKYRDVNDLFYGKYQVIVVGALMMRAGAKIRDEDIRYLRDLVPRINCNEGYTWPLGDQGFRGPGKRQFLTALDHYQPGVPRSFYSPSCFACGKIQVDIGKALQKCARCHEAMYCDKDCQTIHWRSHKPHCKGPRLMPGGFISLNV